MAPIVGSIIERKPTSSISYPSSSPSTRTGFPPVQHRSKKPFLRKREENQANPRIHPPSKLSDVSSLNDRPQHAKVLPEADDEWRNRISGENEEKVANMDDEEREQERLQILERFGSNIGHVLKRAKLLREQQKQKLESLTSDPVLDEVPISVEERKAVRPARSPPPSAMVSQSTTRPSSRADRRLRFAELEPDDVHVYESAPSSPKRRVLALPPPDPDAKDVVSLGSWSGQLNFQNSASGHPSNLINDQPFEKPSYSDSDTTVVEREPEEGTSEYIRRRFFPNAAKDDPNLEWLQQPKPDLTSSALRFDLHGNSIPILTSLTLPTHLGLHHHAEGAHAGYTLDDIFLLTRSTVPSQRATMLSILARIAHQLPGIRRGESPGLEQLSGTEEELRRRILAAGLESLGDRGNSGVRAIEIVWECVVGWTQDLLHIEQVEIESAHHKVVTDLPFNFVLPQIESIISQEAIPPESQLQLLSILIRLSQQSNIIANKIASTPKLLATVLRKFLLVPVSSLDSSPTPDPLALQFFSIITLASRLNAEKISQIGDSFLRFVAILPHSSPYPFSLATNLLIGTLRIYRALASYGLYAEVASIAITSFAQLEQYVVSKECTSIPLKVAWSSLVEAWTTCAIDPHQTTPAHSIIWSQIIGWRWDTSILELQDFLGVDEGEWNAWVATWKFQAAWLEGSKLNAVKGGEAERTEFLEVAKQHFHDGKASKVVVAALDRIEQQCRGFLESEDKIGVLKVISNLSSVLGSLTRLWLACLPRHLEGPPAIPPFHLPYSRFSEVTARLVTHPLWSLSMPNDSFGYLYCREISDFLGFYLRLSKKLPDVTDALYATQACAIAQRLSPGDEDFAEDAIKDLIDFIPSFWLATQGNDAPRISKEQSPMLILEPYVQQKLYPDRELRIAPLTVTTKSINTARTLRLPSPALMKKMPLPLSRDWSLSPIGDLLKSGESEVFKMFPSALTVSEVEVTQACLILTKLVQKTLGDRSLQSLMLTRQEAVFRCMQIFMLEHGQPQNDSTEEVYRDTVVGRLMDDILQVYRSGQKPEFPSFPDEEDIEQVAARFLGRSIPFFQFYTDFVSLYDAVSFSHPLFASLLLPPTSMKYSEDYRKHLWCDFGHILGSIRISTKMVISADLREYLYPVETQSQMISAYLKSIINGNVQNFLYFVAVHHVACNIWPDLLENERNDEKNGIAILRVLLQQGRNDAVKNLVRYRQRRENVLFPPECFERLDEQTVVSRRGHVVKWGGPYLKLLHLFE